MNNIEVTSGRGLNLNGQEDPSQVREKLISTVYKILGSGKCEPKYEKGVVLLGNTGAGKSTLTNILSGQVSVITKKNTRKRLCFAVENEKNAVAKIGDDIRVAETQDPNYTSIGGSDIEFIDCPGLFDTRGWYAQIKGATHMTKVIEEVENIKLALVVSSEDFGARCRNGSQFFENIREMFRSLRLDLRQSLYKNTVIVISKASLEHRNEDIKEVLALAVDHLSRDIRGANIVPFYKPKGYGLKKEGEAISTKHIPELIDKLKGGEFTKDIKAEIFLTAETEKEVNIIVNDCAMKCPKILHKILELTKYNIARMQEEELKKFDEKINEHNMGYEECCELFPGENRRELEQMVENIKACLKFLDFAPKLLNTNLKVDLKAFKRKTKEFHDNIKKHLTYEIKKRNTKNLLGNLYEEKDGNYPSLHISNLLDNLRNNSFIRDERGKISLTEKAGKKLNAMRNEFMDAHKECSIDVLNFIKDTIKSLDDNRLTLLHSGTDIARVSYEYYENFFPETKRQKLKELLTDLRNYEYFLAQAPDKLYVGPKVKPQKFQKNQREYNEKIKKCLKYEICKYNTKNLLGDLRENAGETYSQPPIQSLLDGLENNSLVKNEQGTISFTTKAEKQVNDILNNCVIQYQNCLNTMLFSLRSSISCNSIDQLNNLDREASYNIAYEQYKKYISQDKSKAFGDSLCNLQKYELFLNEAPKTLDITSKIDKRLFQGYKQLFHARMKAYLKFEIGIRDVLGILNQLKKDRDYITKEMNQKLFDLENKKKGLEKNKYTKKEEYQSVERYKDNEEASLRTKNKLKEDLSGIKTWFGRAFEWMGLKEETWLFGSSIQELNKSRRYTREIATSEKNIAESDNKIYFIKKEIGYIDEYIKRNADEVTCTYRNHQERIAKKARDIERQGRLLDNLRKSQNDIPYV